jgi:CheY-like chemotaxis protein
MIVDDEAWIRDTVREIFSSRGVQVLEAEVGDAFGAEPLHHVLPHLLYGDVQGAPALVVHGDDLILLLVETIGQRC